MAIAPTNVAVIFYVLENYVFDDSQFSALVRAEKPFSYPRTTNGHESFHSNYDQQF